MKLVEEKAYNAVCVSVLQLLQMNRTELLQTYPYYAVLQTGPIGKMEQFIQYASRLYQNVKSTTPVVNNVLIWALSEPVVQLNMITENLSSEGIKENNNYPNSIGQYGMDRNS